MKQLSIVTITLLALAAVSGCPGGEPPIDRSPWASPGSPLVVGNISNVCFRPTSPNAQFNEGTKVAVYEVEGFLCADEVCRPTTTFIGSTEGRSDGQPLLAPYYGETMSNTMVKLSSYTSAEEVQRTIAEDKFSNLGGNGLAWNEVLSECGMEPDFIRYGVINPYKAYEETSEVCDLIDNDLVRGLCWTYEEVLEPRPEWAHVTAWPE